MTMDSGDIWHRAEVIAVIATFIGTLYIGNLIQFTHIILLNIFSIIFVSIAIARNKKDKDLRRIELLFDLSRIVLLFFFIYISYKNNLDVVTPTPGF